MLPARTLLNPPPVGDLLAELAAFGERVARLLADTTADWSRQPAAGEWSLTEIACHLRDVEREVHQARFIALLEDDSAFLPGVDADEWAVTRNYRAQDGRAAAAAFVTARAETLARLAPLPLDAVSYTHLRDDRGDHGRAGDRRGEVRGDEGPDHCGSIRASRKDRRGRKDRKGRSLLCVLCVLCVRSYSLSLRPR